MPSAAPARWADESEFGQRTDDYQNVFLIEADGTYVCEWEARRELLSTSAAQKFAQVRFKYVPDAERVRVLAASTNNGGEDIQVPLESIEDKEIASGDDGFTSDRQVLVSYPALEIGSRLHFRARLEHFRAGVPGFFDQSFVLHDWWARAARYEFRSSTPLFVETQDPDGFLVVSERDLGPTASHRYEVVVVLARELIRGVSEEDYAPSAPRSAPRFKVTSRSTWRDAFQGYAQQWEDHFSREIPAAASLRAFEPLRSAITAAARLDDPFDRIDAVTSAISEHVRYAGDWRSTEKGYLPRPFGVVLGKRGGDCKDFTSLTVAALRMLGMRAHAAIVHRGEEPPDGFGVLPVDEFNHAVVAAQIDGRTVWLDPTNFSSFARGKRSDIAGRRAVILDPEDTRVAEIPAIGPSDGVVDIRRIYLLERGKAEIDATGTIERKGISAAYFAGLALRFSRGSVEEIIANDIFVDANVRERQVAPFDLKSRIVADYTFHAKAKLRNPVKRATSGVVFSIPASMGAERFREDVTDRLSDLTLGLPRSETVTTTLVGVRLLGEQVSRCSVRSPWFDGSLEIEQKDPLAIVITHQAIRKVSSIANDDLRSSAYAKFRREFEECLDGTSLLLDYVASSVAVRAEGPAELADRDRLAHAALANVAPPSARAASAGALDAPYTSVPR